MINLLWLTRGDESEGVWDTPVAGDGVVEIWVGGVGVLSGVSWGRVVSRVKEFDS